MNGVGENIIIFELLLNIQKKDFVGFTFILNKNLTQEEDELIA